MTLETTKIDCEFIINDGSRLRGLAHLFWHDYRDHTFWHGVAQLTDSLRSNLNPSMPFDATVLFADGRTGHVKFAFGKYQSGGYEEIGFIGLDSLKTATQS